MKLRALKIACWFVAVGLVIAPAVAKPAAAADPETYQLRYKLKAGEKIRYEVTHVAKTKTRIRGEEEISNVHTVSERHWDVSEANETDFTFNHIIDSVEMTQQQGDQEELRWDSASGEEPNQVFEKVAEQIGQKLATIKIDTRGEELEREDFGGTKAQLGMGSLALALPEQALAIDDTWTVPREVKARTDDGEVKTIKIQEVYKLEQVKTGVATISIRSEPLTPMGSDSIKAQVIQQLSNGEIRFDIDAGRMISKKLDWDETVVGFQGPNSMMEYRARMTEQLQDGAQRTARLPK
ncbi:hypothetical protein [Rubripirellula amarantea]|uniref:hypothetical protein n=1 Tax=Rubripirellula amarantea TaxID=2527999 RepID=UPI0011B66DDC|nr:hypothetical protein [Rubripirellula amarantea]